MTERASLLRRMRVPIALGGLVALVAGAGSAGAQTLQSSAASPSGCVIAKAGTNTFNSGAFGLPNTLGQLLPQATTVTTIFAQATLTTPLTLVGSTITVEARLYVNNAPTDVRCLLGSLTGVLSIGEVFTCNFIGASLPIAAGAQAVLVFSATAAGLSLINTIGMTAAAAVA
jgi:hypothetical protein